MSANAISSDQLSCEVMLDKSVKHRKRKPKLSEIELVRLFWEAPMEAFFSQVAIAPVLGSREKTLEQERWRGTGVPFRKISGRVLYKKSDVINYLESHELVNSTSEYKRGGNNHA